MRQIVALNLPEEFNMYTGSDGEPIEAIDQLSKINIFVGSNNSGKSRFMRLLSRQKSYYGRTNDIDIKEANSIVIGALVSIKDTFERYGLSQVNSISVNEIERFMALPKFLNFGDDAYKEIRRKLEDWGNIQSVSSTTSGQNFRGSSSPDNVELVKVIRSQTSNALQTLQSFPVFSESSAPRKVYIPILRGLRPMDDQQSDLYQARTKADYFSSGEAAPPEIFTGLSLYQRLIEMLLGTNAERKTIDNYQKFISRTLFEDRPVALIPSQSKRVVVVKIGNEQEQPIYHLGDGIQTAIILSFLPYIIKDHTFFFIEEPEMHLHPGLQRKILEFFASISNHTFFMTTHSNHFLDITIDIKNTSIYTFRKHLNTEDDNDELVPNFSIESVDIGSMSSLELLGVRNSSVFLVNATIWVEGITDRWYLKSMLISYMAHLKRDNSLALRLEEDVHYSFVEYGGANITHWSFLDDEEHPIQVDRLCARALLIVDNDGNSKLRRKENLEATMGERLIVLPGREVENLLPYELLRQVVLDYEGTPERVLPAHDYVTYQSSYLGNFIEKQILGGEFRRRGGYAEASGTIKSKREFCQKAINLIDYENLPESTQSVIRQIYEFIVLQNT